jgi:MYXO-CTERM domain-containing protein
MPVVDDVYVDAKLGGVVDRRPRVHSARVRSTYNAGGQENSGTLARNEGSGPTGDQDVDEAHGSAGLTYDCLQTLFNRDSFDGQGQGLVSIANFGQNFQNAFWDGSKMTYGDGMGVPDIGTHEFVHAVTEYTGNMVYQNEPGALNEAWSDIISAVCQANSAGTVSSATWQLGETSILGTLRYMNNPTQDGISSDHYDSRYLGTEDEGGVHLNSGIANLAFYLLSQGGTHPAGKSSVNVLPIGIADAGQIFYLALSSHMNTNSKFLDARAATETAAAQLYGAGSSKAISVSEAWQSVGVGGPAPERLEEEPTPEDPSDPDPTEDPTIPDPSDDGTGTGDGDGGGGGGGGGTQAGTGTVTGGCSAGGSGSGFGFSLLLLLGFASLCRRKEDR